MMNPGGATMSKELLDFFDFNINNLVLYQHLRQQRSKVSPEVSLNIYLNLFTG